MCGRAHPAACSGLLPCSRWGTLWFHARKASAGLCSHKKLCLCSPRPSVVRAQARARVPSRTYQAPLRSRPGLPPKLAGAIRVISASGQGAQGPAPAAGHRSARALQDRQESGLAARPIRVPTALPLHDWVPLQRASPAWLCALTAATTTSWRPHAQSRRATAFAPQDFLLACSLAAQGMQDTMRWQQHQRAPGNAGAARLQRKHELGLGSPSSSRSWRETK